MIGYYHMGRQVLSDGTRCVGDMDANEHRR